MKSKEKKGGGWFMKVPFFRFVLSNNGASERGMVALLKKTGFEEVGREKVFWVDEKLCSPRSSFADIYCLQCGSEGYIIAFLNKPVGHCMEVWRVGAVKDRLKFLFRRLGHGGKKLEIAFQGR